MRPARSTAAFAALGHPLRLAIVRLLLTRGPMTVNAIARGVKAAQSQASRHLGRLREAGLLTARRDGLHVYYAADAKVLEAAIMVLRKAGWK